MSLPLLCGAPRGRYGLTRTLHDAPADYRPSQYRARALCGALAYGEADEREVRRNGHNRCQRCAAKRLRAVT